MAQVGLPPGGSPYAIAGSARYSAASTSSPFSGSNRFSGSSGSARHSGSVDSPGCLRSFFCCSCGGGSAGGGTIGVDAGADGPRPPQPPRGTDAKALARRARNSVLIYHAQAAKRPLRQAREGGPHMTNFLDGAAMLARRARNSILIFRPAPKVGPEPSSTAGAAPHGQRGFAAAGTPRAAGEERSAAAAPAAAATLQGQERYDDESESEVQVVAVAQLLLPVNGGVGGVLVAQGSGPPKPAPAGLPPASPTEAEPGPPGPVLEARAARLSKPGNGSRRGAWEDV